MGEQPAAIYFESNSRERLNGGALRDALETQGCFVVRNLLSASEIAKLRVIVRERVMVSGRRLSLGRTQPNAAIEVPALAWVLAHLNIVQVFRELLDEPMFTGHCDIHMNLLSGWHKDSGEIYGGYFTGDYFRASDCRVVKAAIYLQDAGEHDGLTVKLGSHRNKEHAGVEHKLETKAGDVVFFDVRISHTGQLPDLVETGIKALSRIATKGNRSVQEPAWVHSLKDVYWKLIGRRDRLSIFYTYGEGNTYTQEFAASNMDRQARQAGQKNSLYPDELVKKLEEQRIEMYEST